MQLVSALINNGPKRQGSLRDEFDRWMDEHGNASGEEIRGVASHAKNEDPTVLERANYLQIVGPKQPCENRTHPAAAPLTFHAPNGTLRPSNGAMAKW